MDDLMPTAVTVEVCPEEGSRFRWHLSSADGVSIRVSPESYPTADEAGEAGALALSSFGAAQ